MTPNSMAAFLSGIDYWKDCNRGMQDAAAYLGVKAVYTGTPDYDITKDAEALDSTIAQQPAGLLVTVINADGLKPSIDKAVAAGTPIVTFDADSPASKRHSFVGTGNYAADVVAARYLGPLVKAGKEGTLDLIDKGDLGATLAQGTWQMGFWGMLFLYMVRNSKIKSVTDWKAAGISPLPRALIPVLLSSTRTTANIGELPRSNLSKGVKVCASINLSNR
ncbi:MAG: substrate-binding domain-containing protein [Chloroflexota bacterium]